MNASSPDHVPGSGDFTYPSASGDAVVAEQAELANPVPVHVGIVVARFNAGITESLFHGAVAALISKGIPSANIEAVQVPGAVELPIVAHRLAASRRVRAVVVLGCVIRGETSHYDYVCSIAADGVLRVSLDTGVPVGFGVITAENREQATARSQAWPDGHNVGADAALAALETAAVLLTSAG